MATSAATKEELLSAVNSSDADAVQRLLNSSQLGPDDMMYRKDAEWITSTVLHLAASQGDLDVVHLLLAAWPAGAQERDEFGNLPLHEACLNGSVEVAQLLLEGRPDGVKVANYYGRTSLHSAAASGSVELMKLLLDRWPEGLNVADVWGNTVLHGAAASGSVELVKLLLERWPEGLNVAGYSGKTVLHDAAASGRVELVKLLLERWPEGLNIADNYGNTVLHGAAASGSVELVKLLLDRWPEGLNVADVWGNTFLHGAAASGSVELVKLLLERWPEALTVPNQYGIAPLHEASTLEVALLLMNMAPRQSYTSRLSCIILVTSACIGEEVDQSWKAAAAELQCSSPESLRKQHLQLWLDGCGGNPSWADNFGALVSKLRDPEAKDRQTGFPCAYKSPNPPLYTKSISCAKTPTFSGCVILHPCCLD